MTRAMMSLGPPAGNGTIRRICRAGNSSAVADAADSRANPVTKARKTFMGDALTVEQLERRFVCARVAGGDNTAAALRGLAFPGGDDAARAGNDRNVRGDVVGLEFGLDDEIEMAGGEHAVGVAVAAITVEPHLSGNAIERGAVGLVHQ